MISNWSICGIQFATPAQLDFATPRFIQWEGEEAEARERYLKYRRVCPVIELRDPTGALVERQDLVLETIRAGKTLAAVGQLFYKED